MLAGELTGQDVVLVLNFSRFYRIDEKMAEMLAAQQVPYFVITDSMASPFVKGGAGGFAGGYRALRLFPFHDRGGGYSGIPADFDVLGTAGELPCKAPAAGRHSGGIPRR